MEVDFASLVHVEVRRPRNHCSLCRLFTARVSAILFLDLRSQQIHTLILRGVLLLARS